MAQSYIQVPPNSTKSSDSPQLSAKQGEGRWRPSDGRGGPSWSRWFLWLIFDS